MITVHPSIILGSYLWDQERLPRDEFDIRMEWINTAMKERGLTAMLVYGDAREHAALSFFSNFIPRMRWAMAMFPSDGDARLLASMSSRDMPAMRTMTWLPDVNSGWEWRWFDEWVAALPGKGRIGIIGYDLMTLLLSDNVEHSLAGRFELVPCDDVSARARTHHRPREIAIIREAAAIVRTAGDSIRTALARGMDAEHAALAGEIIARSSAAHDVRTLVSRDGGRTLQPYAARLDDHPAPAFAYVAVKLQGYWAETFVSRGTRPALDQTARRALEAVLAGMRPGVSFSELAKKGMQALGGASLHPVLSGSFGRRIGLSLDEGLPIRIGADELVEENTVYALHSGLVEGDAGTIVSALVRSRAEGEPEILLDDKTR